MKHIAAALLKVQQELDPVKKGKKGHNNKYADLPAVLDEAVGKLNEHGVVVLQPIQPASMANYARVQTILLHAESGEVMEGAAEVPWRSESKMNDAQSYGSAVTYARRYSLVSILGISTEDDDGASAQQRPQRTQQPPQSPPPARPTAAEWFTTFRSKLSNQPDRVSFIEQNAGALERLAANEAFSEEAKEYLRETGRAI